MNHVGFNITEKKLQVVEIVKISNIYYLEYVDEENFPENLDFHSDNFIDILQTAFDDLKGRHSFKGKLVSISLPLQLFKIFQFPLMREISESDLKAHIELEFSVLFPTDSFQDYIIRPKKISKGIYSYSEILVVAIEKSLLQKLHNLLTENNYVLQFVDNAHFSNDLLLRKSSLVSVYNGNNSISCSAYINNNLIGFRKFDTDNINGLLEYIRELKHREDLNLSDYIISGDTDYSFLVQEIEKLLNLEFNVPEPFNRIDPSESFTKTDCYENNSSLFSSAAGICYRIS